jgi:peptidoglycan/xylan/chitin deacetylase (PgdA/CDA1 family)
MNIVNSLNLKITARIPVKMVKNKATRPLASISFDDFPKSAWQVGGKILDKYGVKGTYYAVGDFCSKVAEGVQQYDADDIRELVAQGHELGSHTYKHTSVFTVSNAALRKEEADNQAFFNEILGDYRLSTFAYPFGDISPRTKKLYSELYPLSRGIRHGVNGKWFDMAQLKAVPIESRLWNPEFIENWVREASEKNAYLCLFTPDISDNPTPWGATPQMLDHALEMLKKYEIEVLTVKAAMAVTQFGE